LLGFHCGGVVSVQGQLVCDLWWTKWQCDRLFFENCGYFLSVLLSQCSVFIGSSVLVSVIKSLAPELSVQCTLQKTWDLNGLPLLCVLMANGFK